MRLVQRKPVVVVNVVVAERNLWRVCKHTTLGKGGDAVPNESGWLQQCQVRTDDVMRRFWFGLDHDWCQ